MVQLYIIILNTAFISGFVIAAIIIARISLKKFLSSFLPLGETRAGGRKREEKIISLINEHKED